MSAEAGQGRRAVSRLLRQFPHEYRLLAYYAAIPLVITPELLNYLREAFLRGKVPWVAEVDLLLSDLFKQIGYEQYSMDFALREYLLEQMHQELGLEPMENAARLIIQHTKQLFKTSDLFSDEQLENQQLAAMVILKDRRDQVVEKIIQEVNNFATPLNNKHQPPYSLICREKLRRLSSLVEVLAPQLGNYSELLAYARLAGQLLSPSISVDLPGLRKAKAYSQSTRVTGTSAELPPLYMLDANIRKTSREILVDPLLPFVLVVENDPVWQDFLKKILTRNDEFNVICVSNIFDALSLFKSSKTTFKIVVSDVNLDGEDPDNVDGFQLLEEMLKTKYPARAIVIDEHLDTIGRFKRALELRALDYFDKIPPNKPFNEHRFMEAVRKAAEQTGVIDVFAIMPFDPKYWNFYENAIKATFEDMNLSCKRTDEIFHRGVIMKDILRYVRHAKLIVADLSGGNLNVLFEVGLAHALQKPVILLTRNLEDVPAILLDNMQVFEYDVTLFGADRLNSYLGGVLRKIQIGQSPIMFEDLISESDNNLCLGLVPKYHSEKKDAYTHIIKYVAGEIRLNAKRLDEITDSGTMMDKAWKYINRARIIVADFTEFDPRVYYWSGVAYGLEKDMITLARKGEEIPFDLRSIHGIEYSMGFEEASDARENLKNAMKLLLQRSPKPKSAKTNAAESIVGSKEREPETTVEQKGSTMPKKTKKQSVDVVILTVLEEEYQAICRQLDDLQPLPGTETKPNLYAWQTGNVFSANYGSTYRVVVGITGRAGNPQSTMATIEGVNILNPRYIFFSGIAGGLLDFENAAQDPSFKPNIHLGDVVIADVIHGYEYGKIETDFHPRGDWTYHTDLGLLTKATAYGLNPDWRKFIRLSSPKKRQPKVICGQIASGDKVVDDPTNAFFATVYRKWPKVKAVEMEGAGVAAAINHARDQGKIVGFMMIRGISDIPRPPESVELFQKWEGERGAQERDNWKPYAADVAAAFTTGLIANGLPVPPRASNQ